MTLNPVFIASNNLFKLFTESRLFCTGARLDIVNIPGGQLLLTSYGSFQSIVRLAINAWSITQQAFLVHLQVYLNPPQPARLDDQKKQLFGFNALFSQPKIFWVFFLKSFLSDRVVWNTWVTFSQISSFNPYQIRTSSILSNILWKITCLIKYPVAVILMCPIHTFNQRIRTYRTDLHPVQRSF